MREKNTRQWTSCVQVTGIYIYIYTYFLSILHIPGYYKLQVRRHAYTCDVMHQNTH